MEHASPLSRPTPAVAKRRPKVLIGQRAVRVPASCAVEAAYYRELGAAFDRHCQDFAGDPFPSFLESLLHEDLASPGPR